MEEEFFEPSPTRYPIFQPTDSLADLLGDPEYCGARSYRFLYYDSRNLNNELSTVLEWMTIDYATMEYYMDVSHEFDDITKIREFELVLEVTLTDWVDVTPSYLFLEAKIVCPTAPTLHSRLSTTGSLLPTSITYDVTEASA